MFSRKIFTGRENVIIKGNMIQFKSRPEFFEKERSGIKNNTVRYLSSREFIEVKILQRTYDISKIYIKIKNTETDEVFCRLLRDISSNDDVTVFTWAAKEIPLCELCGNPILKKTKSGYCGACSK